MIDFVSETLFHQDDKGNIVFYPWGIFGKGIIVEHTNTKVQIISFLSLYNKITFTLLICLAIVLNYVKLSDISIYVGSIVFMMTSWYYMKIRVLTQNLSPSTMKLKISDAWKNGAKHFSRHTIIGGLITMVLLICFSILFILIDNTSMGLIYGSLLFGLGIFGAYGYYQILQYAETQIPSESTSNINTKSQKSRKIEKSINWTTANISILISVSGAIILMLYIVYVNSSKNFKERMDRYNQMSLEQMASYLSERNAKPHLIDPLTLHAGTDSDATSVYFYRELLSNPLGNTIVDRNNPENEKLKMSRQLQQDMCNLPTWKLFYQKGGNVVYLYYEETDNGRSTLFEIHINQKFCSEKNNKLQKI